MTFALYLYLIYNLITLQSVGNAERKITGGHNVTINHAFMVYVIEEEKKLLPYLGWTCAGAIIGRRMVITAAACVQDVPRLYVIAGYRYYVPADKREDDKCITNMKKRVIAAGLPQDYALVYNKSSIWASYDIAVLKTESNMVDEPNYARFCNYLPKIISINFGSKDLQNTGKDVFILGWGHQKYWKELQWDDEDINQRHLQFGPMKIYDKKRCMAKFRRYKIAEQIDKYMICTWPPAGFNDRGSHEEEDSEKGEEHDGCSSKEVNSTIEGKGGKNGKDGKNGKGGKYTTTVTVDPYINQKMSQELMDNPKVGICQNDHGSPLITWKRSKPEIIGVASVFRNNTDGTCYGPYLYTSTYCTSKFLQCVIQELIEYEEANNKTVPKKTPTTTTSTKKKSNSGSEDHSLEFQFWTMEGGINTTVIDFCRLPPKKRGFRILKRKIAWLKHLNGSSKSEKFRIRPQVPLQNLGR